MQLLDQFLLLAQTQWRLGVPAFAAGLPKGPNGALVPDRPKRLPLLGRNDAVRSAPVLGRSIVPQAGSSVLTSWFELTKR